MDEAICQLTTQPGDVRDLIQAEPPTELAHLVQSVEQSVSMEASPVVDQDSTTEYGGMSERHGRMVARDHSGGRRS